MARRGSFYYGAGLKSRLDLDNYDTQNWVWQPGVTAAIVVFMSTRSVIAIPDGDQYKGRYCHSDGYPSWNGRVLHELVNAHGVEKVRRILVEDNFYWSSIKAEATTETTNSEDLYTRNSDGGRTWHRHMAYNCDPERFKFVPGFGMAGTENQTSPDEWHLPEHEPDSWCEWVYILADAGLMVRRCGGTKMAMVAYADKNPDWEKVAEQCS